MLPTIKAYFSNCLSFIRLILPICLWANVFLQAQPTLQYTIEDGLPTHHIYDALEGPEGFIWLVTNRGLVKFDGHEFTVFTHKDGLPNNDVWKLRIDAENRLWFFSKSNRQGYIQNDSIHTFKVSNDEIISPNNVFAYPDGIVIAYDKFRDNKFVPNPDYNKYNLLYNKKNIQVKDDSIVLFDENNKILNAVNKDYLGFYTNWKVDYFPHQQYVLRGSGWTLFGDDKTDKLRIYHNESLGISKNKVVLVKFINNQFQISNGEHLIILNKIFDVVHHYKFDPSINNNFALKDSKGNIWLWGKKIGLKLITNVQLNTNHYLVGEKVNVIGQMADKIVSASESSGFHFYNGHSNTFEKHPFVSDMIDVPYHIVEYPTDQYLVTNKLGVKYSTHDGYSMVGSIDIPGYNGGKDLLMYQGDDYWVTSAYLVSNSLDISIKQKGLNDIEEWNGNIVLSSVEGLKVLKDSIILPYLPNDSTLNFPTTRLVKGKNNLWIGTDGKGVYGYNKNGLKQLESTEDLIIREIIESGDTLWISTNNGVKKIVLDNDIEQSYISDNLYKNDGLLQNNTNDIYIRNDSLWVATDEGISVLDMNTNGTSIPTLLYFKDLGDSLTIEGQENRNLNIAFGARNFGNQENLKFSYRLWPSEDWIETSARSISFNDLKPDNYTLQLRAIDQHYKKTQINLPIIVMPLWWESDLAIGLFILVGMGILLLFVYLIYSVFQQRKIKKIEQEKRVQGLQLQALRSQMNPHFVHNSLNAIQYFIQMNDVEKSEEYLSKFSELIRLFFEFSRENQITLDQEIMLLKRYIEIEKLRFEERLNYKIEIDPKLYTEEQEIPTMILQPLVENAINHGLFHKKEMGNLLIKFEKLCEGGYKVMISDDGIGIEKAKEIFKKSVKNYKSNSSMVLDERLKLLNQSGEWTIEYKIESNSIGPNTGTTITIIFKH